jgi:glycosyltransferase involved in cell wall biosynthesis
VGTITRRKGIHLIIDAFKKLNIPNSLLEIVGPVSDGGDLLENLPDNIKHVPYLNHDELVSYYQRADVFVFPSYLDSWAMVVLEAMACGTPVIISENTGSRDAVEKGGGFVIPVDDANALMEKILYFYQNPEIIESTGRKAHQIAQHYTWQHYYQNVQRAVEEIYNREIEKQR